MYDREYILFGLQLTLSIYVRYVLFICFKPPQYAGMPANKYQKQSFVLTSVIC